MEPSKTIYFLNIPEGASYNVKQLRKNYPAFGIMLLASILNKVGYRARIVDFTNLKDDIENVLFEIKKDAPLFIGLSVMTPQIPEALCISKYLKERFHSIPVIWGGAHASLFPKETLESSYVDIVAVNEIANRIVLLADSLCDNKPLSEIKGIGFKEAGRIIINEPGELDNIEECPHLDFGVLPDIESYALDNAFAAGMHVDASKSRTFPVISGLGCCYKCSFCINVALNRRYRWRSASEIIEEVKRLQRDYDANCIVFQDEDFFINKKRLFEFLDLIEKEKLSFKWRTWGRANYFNENYLNKDVVKRLDRLGLRQIAIGAESGSDRILKMIKKGITAENIVMSAEYLKGSNIEGRYSFIYGFPNETKDDLLKTFLLTARLKRINKRAAIAGPYFLRLYPGSPLFDSIKNDYEIAVPKTVGEWSGAFSHQGFLHQSRYPWLSKEQYALSQKLVFYLHHLPFAESKNKLKRILNNVLTIVSRLRYRFNIFALPIEYYLLIGVKKIFRQKAG